MQLTKRQQREKRKQYFDANTLTIGDCQIEIRHFKKSGYLGVTSFLAIGEAISHILLDNLEDGGEEGAIISTEAFIKFLTRQISDGCLTLLTAENVNAELKFILENTSLDVADAHHLAIAIKNKCVNLVTTDGGLLGSLPNQKLDLIKEKFGIDEFTIVKRELPKE